MIRTYVRAPTVPVSWEGAFKGSLERLSRWYEAEMVLCAVRGSVDRSVDRADAGPRRPPAGCVRAISA
jgi:hypothetical protein